MKTSGRVAFLGGLLVLILFSISCGLGDMFAPPTPTSTATHTNTPTLTPTATHTPLPTATFTPEPAVFSNPPAYLEQAFSATGWVWRNTTGGRIGTRRHDGSTMITLAHDHNSIFIGGIWNKDKGDFDFVNNFFPIPLQDFVSPSTAAKILQFKDENLNNDAGKYQEVIDRFEVELFISDDDAKNTRTVLLSVTEEGSYR
ncbi:MAG: hypothetical protein Kow002_04570 [Anaerolineales bacterium]